MCAPILLAQTGATARLPLVVPSVVPDAAPVVTERVTTVRVTVHGAWLEGNLEGDAPDRGVIVYVPPSYARSPGRRYPVVHALGGYSIRYEKWATEIHTLQTVEGAFATGMVSALTRPICTASCTITGSRTR